MKNRIIKVVVYFLLVVSSLIGLKLCGDYKGWVYLGLPWVGVFVGNVSILFLESSKTLFRMFVVFSLISLLGVLSGVSCSYNIVDEIVIVSALLFVGLCIVGIEKHESLKVRKFLFLFKRLTFLFYVLVPFMLFGWLVIAFSNDFVGSVQHIDDYESYKIKHKKLNSNFNFSGYHDVVIYKKAFLVEYPYKETRLGTYGESGLGVSVDIDGEWESATRFSYDFSKDALIMSRYVESEFKKYKTYKLK